MLDPLIHLEMEGKQLISLISVLIISLPNLFFYFGIISSVNLMGYEFGYELLPLNGLITFLGLILIGRK